MLNTKFDQNWLPNFRGNVIGTFFMNGCHGNQSSIVIFMKAPCMLSVHCLLKPCELENVFIKHYAPNHMPDPKGEWSLKENNSELHHGIRSKVNQFIYTLVCNFMSNIRILAKAVLQIFCSQGFSYKVEKGA